MSLASRLCLKMPLAALRITAVLTLVLLLFCSRHTTHAEPLLLDDFEGSETSWSERGGDVQYRIRTHRRSDEQAHGGRTSEYIAVEAGNGSRIEMGRRIPPARVIDELELSLWVKSDRPGIRMLGRVVLPRTIDPRTGEAAWLVVGGSSYSAKGTWQRIRLAAVPQQMGDEVRLLRSRLGSTVDTREAFIDEVRLNVYGGQGITHIWLDDLEIRGAVSAAGHASPSQGGSPQVTSTTARMAEKPPPEIRFEGSVLTVDGKPLFPRAIQHRGEPLSALARLGFNVVWLTAPPDGQLLSDAKARGLWLIAPPPLDADVEGDDRREFGADWDVVLAWDLGSKLTSQQLGRTRRWAERVRAADRRVGRPLIAEATSDLWALSRHVDVLRFDRRPLGSSLELNDFAVWLRHWPRLARPGTPVWATIQTDASESVEGQLAAIAPGEAAEPTVTPDQVRLLVASALSAGVRGLLFSSSARLDASDRATQTRAMALELINHELELAAPWAAAGTFLSTLNDAEQNLSGAVLQTNRARLVTPMLSTKGAQFVPGQSAATAVSLVVPGASEASRAFEITPTGQRPLRDSRRVTGGVRVTMDEIDVSSLVVLTQDPLTLAHFARHRATSARRAAELQRALSLSKLESVLRVESQLEGAAPAIAEAGNWLSAARASLDRADDMLRSAQYESAYFEARRAARPLRMIERSRWEQATASLASAVASPAAIGYGSLPLHWRHVARLELSLPRNLLPAGHFEDLRRMQAAGWRHLTLASRGETSPVETKVELSPVEPHSGRYCLRMVVEPKTPEQAAALIESAPLWVTSPEVPVEAGDWVRIGGWVRVAEPLSGTVDGLMIFDSLGGADLAIRVNQTGGWRPFALYRIAPTSGTVQVTFALTGFGAAMLDDVTIATIDPHREEAPLQAKTQPLPRIERLPLVR